MDEARRRRRRQQMHMAGSGGSGRRRGGSDRRRPDPRGPSREEIAEAIEAVLDHEVPGTPPMSAVRTIQDSIGLPFSVEDRTIKDARITLGDPDHGAMRSDDHVGGYEVILPFSDVKSEVVVADQCPECGIGNEALYRYRTMHNIAGNEVVFCANCESKLHCEEWD